MTGGWPRPEVVGCTRCGDQVLVHFAVYAQCDGCGKTCGLCDWCARVLGRNFVRDAMAFHRRVKHPDLVLATTVRRALVQPRAGVRRWGERFEI